MIPHRRVRRLIATSAAVAALAIIPSALFAQNNPNTTGLPMYPHLTTGSEYPAVKTKAGNYKIYTAQSSDAIATVEAWYRHALPKAVETKDDNALTHGIVLTMGKDKVLVYTLGKNGKAAVVELQKYLGS
ncbi:MAG TPA: hypothetical protein VK511_00520 [Gemmatimonadaceae bacterium]|nr:hypothetical protein [Gemmatimonadaceae bacterium]